MSDGTPAESRASFTCLYCGVAFSAEQDHHCPQSEGASQRLQTLQPRPPIDYWRVLYEYRMLGASRDKLVGFIFDTWFEIAVPYRPWIERLVCRRFGHRNRPYLAENVKTDSPRDPLSLLRVERVFYEACWICGWKRDGYLIERWFADSDEEEDDEGDPRSSA